MLLLIPVGNNGTTDTFKPDCHDSECKVILILGGNCVRKAL